MTAEERHAIELTWRKTAQYDPRAPETESQIMDTMLGPLLPLYLTCISNNVKSVGHLMEGPESITKLVRDPNHRPATLKYLLWRRDNWVTDPQRAALPVELTTQIYADAAE